MKQPIVKPKRLKNSEKLLLLIIAAVAGAAFIWVAASTLDNWFKAPLLPLILFGAGKIIAQIGRFENYHGIIIFRGERGFGLMRYFARFPRAMRALADFGLSMGFGLVYGFLVFKNKPKKFLIHILFVGLFFLYGVSTPYPGDELTNTIIKTAGILGGLLFFGISALLMHGMRILTEEGTTAGAALIVPGVTIPLWEGLIAIIIAASVHEIAHGILAMVEKLELKNSGAILFGVLPVGAFVEPDEKKMAKMEIHKKRRILIAGTTSNFLFSMIFALLLIPITAMVIGYAGGVQIASITKDAALAGILEEKDVITGVNGVGVSTISEFQEQMKGKAEGEVVVLSTNKGDKSVELGENGKMGFIPQNYFPEDIFSLSALLFIASIFYWTALINSALAIINLVPIFLTDGYRLVFEEAKGIFPSKNDTFAKRIAIAAGVASVLLLLVNFLPNFI